MCTATGTGADVAPSIGAQGVPLIPRISSASHRLSSGNLLIVLTFITPASVATRISLEDWRTP
eukprot:6678576-Heterocapsa_arctica.AAC.1